jgi:hypothetical protein
MSSPHHLKRTGAALAVALACAAIPAAAQAAPVGLGTAGNFSVLAGSTVTNTGPTRMSAQLGLHPGTAVTGAPVASAYQIANGPALQAKSDLVKAYKNAAGQASTPLSSAQLSGARFTAGIYRASSELKLSAGSVTLDAQGDPNALFIFQIGSALTTLSATSVALVNGAQACNVFWQVGSSATFGTGSTFVGNVMALTTITAKTGATFNGRLLARNGAVNLDTNTIITSACAPGTTGSDGSDSSDGSGGSGGSDSSDGSGSDGSDGLPPASRSNRRGTATLQRSPGSPGTPDSPSVRDCAEGFYGTVRGRRIARVVFRMDGKRIASRSRSPFRVYVRALSGRHVIKARVTFTDATAAKTLKMNYRACASALLRPRQGPSQFTG